MELRGGLDDGRISLELHTTSTHKSRESTSIRGSAESPRIMVGHYAPTNINKKGRGAEHNHPTKTTSEVVPVACPAPTFGFTQNQTTSTSNPNKNQKTQAGNTVLARGHVI